MEEVESSTIHSLQDNDPSDSASSSDQITVIADLMNDYCDLDGNVDHDLWCDDEDVCNESNGALNVASDLDREWQRRHNQFHTIGYRDGLTAGKEASAQEGFNDGFKQSVLVGYKWGFVRGITSALVHLPIGLKEKLVEVQETREKLRNLHESVHAVSTDKALSEFHADIMATQAKDGSLLHANKTLEFPSSNLLGRYVGEFDSLNDELSTLGMQAVIKSQAMG